MYLTLFHTLHFAKWHFVLRRNFHSIIPSAGFSSRCREYYIWQDREPKLKKMLSTLCYLFWFRGPVSHRSMSIGGKGKKDKKYEFISFKIHHKIKCDGSLNIQQIDWHWSHWKRLNCITFTGERRMERRTGSLASQGSTEKNPGEDIAALLNRLKNVNNSSHLVIFSLSEDINRLGLSRPGSQASHRDSPPSRPWPRRWQPRWRRCQWRTWWPPPLARSR